MSSHHHDDDTDDASSTGYYAPLNDAARIPGVASSGSRSRPSARYTDEEAGLLERALASNDSLADQAFQYDGHLHDEHDQGNRAATGSSNDDDNNDEDEASYSASVLLNKISAAMESEESTPISQSLSSPHRSQSQSQSQSSHRHNLQTAVRLGAMTAAVTADDCSEVQSTADVGGIGGIESAVPASTYAPPSQSARERAQAVLQSRSSRVTSDQMGSASGLAYAVRRSGSTANVRPSLHGSSLRDSACMDCDYDFEDEFSDQEGRGGSSPSRAYSVRTGSTSNSSGRSLRRDRYGNHPATAASYTTLDDASMSESLLDRVAAAERQQQQQQQQAAQGIRRGSYSSQSDDDGAQSMVQSVGGNWYSAAAAAAMGLAGHAIDTAKSTLTPSTAPSAYTSSSRGTSSSRSFASGMSDRRSLHKSDVLDWTEVLPGSSRIPGDKTRRRREFERWLRSRWFVPVLGLLLILIGLVVYFAVRANLAKQRGANYGIDGNDGAGRGSEGDVANPDEPFDLGAFLSPTHSPAPSPDVKAMTHTVPGIDNEDDAGGLTDLNGDGKIDHLDWIASGQAKDVNGDGKIDVMDWALASDGITDLNGDGRIDHLDWILAGDGKDLNGDGKINAQDWVLAGRPGYGLGKYAMGSGVFSVGTSSGGFSQDGSAYKTYDEAGYMVDIGWGAAGVQAGGTYAPTPSPAYLEFITVGEDGKLSWDYAAAAAAGYGHLTEAQIAEILGAADSQRTTEIGQKVTTTTTTTTTTTPGLEVATGSANLSFGSASGGTEETKKANLQWSFPAGEPTPDPAYLDLVEQYVDETGKVSVRWKFPDQPNPSPSVLENIQPDPEYTPPDRDIEVGSVPGMVVSDGLPVVNDQGNPLDSSGQIITDAAGEPIVLETNDQGVPVLDPDGNAVTTTGEIITTTTNNVNNINNINNVTITNIEDISNSNMGMAPAISDTIASEEEEGLGIGDALTENVPDVANNLTPDESTDRDVELAVSYPPETSEEPESESPPGDDMPGMAATGPEPPLDTEITEDEPLSLDVEGAGPGSTDAPVAGPSPPVQQPTWDDSAWEWPNPPELGGGDIETGAPVASPTLADNLPVDTPSPVPPPTDEELPPMAPGLEEEIPMAPGIDVEEILPPTPAPVPSPTYPAPTPPAPTPPVPAPTPVVVTQQVVTQTQQSGAPQQVSGGNTGSYQQPGRVSGGGGYGWQNEGREREWQGRQRGTRAPTAAPFMLHNEEFLETCMEDYGGSKCYVRDEDQLKMAVSHEDDAIYEIYYSNPVKCCGVIVEIGAGNGKEGSVSHFFEYGLHWEAINIEADPENFKQLTANRPDAYNFEGGFCSVDNIVHDDKGFWSTDSEGEVMSEKNLGLMSDGADMGSSSNVPCLSLESDILKPLDITHIDVMVIQSTGLPLATIRKMFWNVRVDIWIILFDEEPANLSYHQVARNVLSNNEYVQAEWDIKRWCGEELNKCRRNEVWLRRGFNPLPGNPERFLKRYLRSGK